MARSQRAATLNKRLGMISSGIDRTGPPGVGLQVGSLTWAGGSTLTFVHGPTGFDEILVAGLLTRAGSGPWNISIDYNGEPFGLSNPPTGALLTFSSTNFSLANFHLELPPGFTGTLVETKTSLLLEDVQAVSASSLRDDSGDGGIALGSGDAGEVHAPMTRGRIAGGVDSSTRTRQRPAPHPRRQRVSRRAEEEEVGRLPHRCPIHRAAFTLVPKLHFGTQ